MTSAPEWVDLDGWVGVAPARHASDYRALPLPLAVEAGAACCGGGAPGSGPAACRLARHVTTKSQIEPVSQPKSTLGLGLG